MDDILEIAESISIEDSPSQSIELSRSTKKVIDNELDDRVKYWIDLIPYILRGEKRMYFRDPKFLKNMRNFEKSKCQKVSNYFSYIPQDSIEDNETIKVNGNIVSLSKAIDFLEFNEFTKLKKDNILNKTIINPEIPYTNSIVDLKIPSILNQLYNIINIDSVLFFNELKLHISEEKNIDYIELPSNDIKNINNIKKSIEDNKDKKIFIASFGRTSKCATLFIIPSKNLMFAYLDNTAYDINKIKRIQLDYDLQIVYPYISESLEKMNEKYSMEIFWDIWLVNLCLFNMDFTDINQLIISSIFKIIMEFGLREYLNMYYNYQLNVSKIVMDENYLSENSSIDDVLESIYFDDNEIIF